MHYIIVFGHSFHIYGHAANSFLFPCFFSWIMCLTHSSALTFYWYAKVMIKKIVYDLKLVDISQCFSMD